MNILGLKRYIDDLGRIVIPKEYRESLGIKEGQQLEICCVNGFIIMSKVEEGGTE